MWDERPQSVGAAGRRADRGGLGAIEFPKDWRDRVAEFASRRYEGPSLRSLNERRRRLARAYADGAYSDAEYRDLRTAVDEQF